jgi:hypothetical protein
MVARGAEDSFEVGARLCVALSIPVVTVTVVLLSVKLGSGPWIPGFSLSGDVAVAEEAGIMVAVGADGVAAAWLSGIADGNAVLCASFQSVSLYKSSLLEESTMLRKRLKI